MYHLGISQLHLPVWKLDNSRALRLVNISRVLYDVSTKLTGFFIPVYVFLLGQNWGYDQWLGINFSSPLEKGIFLVAAYLGGYRLVMTLTAIPLGKMMVKRGAHHSLLAALVLQAVEFLLFYHLESYPLMLGLIVLVTAVKINLYWTIFYTMFSRHATLKHLGSDWAAVEFLLNIFRGLIPAVGGAIAFTLGFPTLFLSGLVVVGINMVVVTLIPEYRLSSQPTWKEFKSLLRKKTFGKLAIAFSGKYINDTVIAIWPIFVLGIVGSIDRVGYLYTVSLLLALVIVYLSGVYVDHQKTKRPYYLSGTLLSIIWVLRMAVNSVWSVLVVETFDRLVATFHWIVYDAAFIKLGKGKKDLSFFLYREMILSMTGVVFWFGMMVLLLLVSVSWKLFFLIGALGVLLTLLIANQDREV